MRKIDLHWQILIAMILAVVCGRITGTAMSVLGITFFQIYELVGTLFLNALRLIIVPLVMATIIHGVANLSGRAGLGRLGGLTLLLVGVMMSVAAPGLPNIPAVLPAMSTQLGPPLEGAALLFAINRVPDMLRIAVDVYGDTRGAVIVAKLRGGQDILVHDQRAEHGPGVVESANL